MEKFLSKLNLYELLTMLIPGSVLLFVLSRHFDTMSIINMSGYNMSFICSIAWIIGAYLIGLVHDSITDWWWKPFRNNPIVITFAATKVSKTTRLKDIQAKSGCLCCLLSCPCFLIRGLAMLIIVCLSPLLRLLHCLCPCLKPDENTEILNRYYMAYYYAEQHRPNASYGNVEYQVAFCRNMLVPLILFTKQSGEIFSDDSSKLCHLMIAFIVILAFFVVYRQEKLYQMILEDDAYLNGLQNETKN